MYHGRVGPQGALAAGDRVHVRTPGGGGCGKPTTRDPQAVEQDVRLGRYTPEAARSLFAVVPGPAPQFSVDDAATARLRADQPRAPGPRE